MSNIEQKQVNKNLPLLKIVNLKKYFPVDRGILSFSKKTVKAVDDVSFEVFTGETLGIVGESGCGKTTIGRVILSLTPATDGKALFDGEDLLSLRKENLRQKRKDMQIIFQDPYASLNPRKKVFDIIAEPFDAFYSGQKELKKEKVNELLDIVGLGGNYATRYPHEFSGGQRQRIGIARALILNPKLVVCDEPVSALDVSVQAQVLTLLERLKKEFKLTYLFISHDLAVVKHISDRIAVMYMGKIVELSNANELYEKPTHPYTEALLSAIPQPDPLKKRNRILLKGEIPSPIDPPSGCRFHNRCPLAIEICKNAVPELKEISDGHYVACHLR